MLLPLTIDNKQLDSVSIGPNRSDEPTFVLLHHGLGCIELWRDFPHQLVERTGISAFLYSRYGYGKSAPLKENRAADYLHQEAHRVLPEVLRNARITAPVLLGHSDGATIALLYAARYPSSAKAIIVEAPHVFVEEITITGLKKTRQAYESGALRKPLKRYHTDVDATFHGWNDIWLDPDFRGWNIEAELADIRCPVLVIQGEDDEYGTGAQLDAIKKQVPHAELYMIPKCRHSPHEDQPELVLKRIEQFLMDVKILPAGN